MLISASGVTQRRHPGRHSGQLLRSRCGWAQECGSSNGCMLHFKLLPFKVLVLLFQHHISARHVNLFCDFCILRMHTLIPVMSTQKVVGVPLPWQHNSVLLAAACMPAFCCWFTTLLVLTAHRQLMINQILLCSLWGFAHWTVDASPSLCLESNQSFRI